MAKSGNSSGLTRSEYVKLRSQGYSSEEIKNNYNGSNSSEQGKSSGSANTNKPLTRAEYVKLRSKGYTKEEINKINKPKKRWVTEETADNAFNSWGSSIDKYQDWAKKQSSYLADWDTTQASYWSNIFTQNAKQANDYLKRLEEAGIRKGNEEYDAYKDYYDYFNDAANGLNANNNSFYDYRKKYMYDAGNGNYLNYDDAKAKQETLQKLDLSNAGRAYKPNINDYVAPGAYYDNETYERNMKQYQQDLAAWESRNKNYEALRGLNTWLGGQDKDKDEADWYVTNLGRGQDSAKVYQNAAARMADVESQMNDLLSRRPDYYSYGQSDEMGNVYAYDDAAYNQAKTAWDAEYDKFRQEVYLPAKRDYDYAQGYQFNSTIQRANTGNRSIRESIERGKAIDAERQAAIKQAQDEALAVAGQLGAASQSGMASATMYYRAGAKERRAADPSTWSEEKLNAYYVLLDEGRTEEADRLAMLTNDAVQKARDYEQILKPLDEFQRGVRDENDNLVLDENGNPVNAGHPRWGTLASFAAGTITPLVFGLPEYFANLTEYAVTGEISNANVTPTQISNRIVSNTAGSLNEWSGTIDDSTPVVGGKGVGDLYQVAISVAQSALSLATGRFVAGGMGLSVGSEAYKKAVQAVTLTQFFGSAASSGIYDALEGGLDPGQAILLGTFNGMAEVAGEVLSVENLINIGDAKTMRNLLRDVFTQAGIEASEEAFTTLLNTMADTIVKGDKNDLQTAINSYISQGMDPTTAEKQAIKDWLNGMGQDALSGFLSGGFSSVIQTGRANIGTYKQNVTYLNDLASQTAEGSRSRQMAEKYGSRERLSKFRGNQYAEQVKQDLISNNTETAVRAIEQQLTERGETGDVHAKAQAIAQAVIADMSGEEAGGWGLTPSAQIAATATKNMREVMDDISKARQEYIDYGRPNSEWTDPIVKGRFLDERVLSRDLGATIKYAQGRNAQKNLEQHTSQIADLERSIPELQQEIQEYRKEIGKLDSKDANTPARRAELQNKIAETRQKITEAENAIKGHQAAILQDGYNSYTEKEKAASVKIDGKEYNVSGLTMANGNAQVKLTDADGNTMNVSMDDERLPAPIRSLAIKANSLGWAAEEAFRHYKPGTNVSDFIRQVQSAKAFASEKMNREAFMNLDVVKDMDNIPMAEFLYSHGQDLYNKRQAAVEKAKTIKNKIVQAAMEKTGDIDNVRTKGKGRVDTTSGWTFSDGKHYEGIQGKKLTKTQNSIVRMINNLADVLNIDYVIFDGDAKGVLGVSQEGGVIAININAGMNVKRALAAETLSHELTHFQENFAPEEYEALRDAVINAAYEKNAELFEKRVQAQMRLLPESIKGDQERYDAAVREVVADACTTMLQNSKVVTELARKNMTLAEKVHDFIEQTINNIKQAIAEAYADSDPAYRRQEVSLIEDRLNEIQELWDEGLRAAVFNYNALQTMRDATEIGSFSIQQFKEAKDSNGDDVFQVAAFEHDEPEYRAMLKTSGMSDTDIDNLFTTIDSAMEIIKGNLEALDYAWEADIDDRGFLPVKPNSDKLYKVSQDFSTLCRKRILQGAIANQLQAALNRALTREEGIAIRDALMAIQAEGKQIEVACALCYVEAARMKSPAQIQKFLNDKEKVLRDYFSGQDRATMKRKIEQAELDVRRQIREELGDITAKDGTQINILDPKDSPLKKLPTKVAQRIRDAKREARSSYTVTEEQQKIIDEAMKMTAYDFTDPVGLENLAKNHREIFDAYTSFVRNATKSKGIENDTWWRAGDSNTISDLLIRQMNDENGLRTQSWSDFQVKHLMDYIAATIELSSRGAKQHAYTKVIDYVDLMGDTGVMINMSLIPTREYNGKLEYDNVEGFVAKEARRLREKYHKTAGTICIGIDNDQIRQLLADDFIDYVIPYHNSGMAAHTRAAMHIPTWENYQDFQGEKKLSRSAAEENAKRFGVKLLEESDPMYHESPNFSDWYSLDRARQLAKNAGKTGKYGVMTGGYAAMQDAARNYMQICAERGLAPKFSYGRADFSGEENYWKLLIDRKMVDNVTGDIIEQEKIQPRFDFNTIERILNDELDRYGKVKADQNEATRRVTEAFLSGKLKAGMSAEAIAEIMQKPVDNISITNITQNAEGTTDQYQMAEEHQGNGYVGYSMSVNARNAYNRGEKPISGWTKQEILDAVDGIDPDKVDMLRKVSVKTLRDHILVLTGWHHTSSMYNRTNFYAVDEDVIDSLTPEKIAAWSRDFANTTKPVEQESFHGDFHYIEWSGTRNHPKANERTLTDVNIRQKGSFYIVTDVEGNELIRKKVGSNGTWFSDYAEAARRQAAMREADERRVASSTEAANELYAELSRTGMERSSSGNIYALGRKPSRADYNNGIENFFMEGEKRLSPNGEGGFAVETFENGNWVPERSAAAPVSQFHDQFQMYDNTADDSIFEAEERQKAWNDLQAENAVLEDTVAQLRKEIEKLSKQTAQLKRTDKPEVRMNDARKMARQIIKDTRPEPITTRDKMEIRELTNRLSQQIKEIGDYILETGKNPNEIDYSEIRSMAQDIARDIVNNAEVEIDDGAGTKDMRDEMRAALRNRPIFVPEQYRSDVLDWNDFKKRYRNIFTFKDSGTDIDIVYQSLLEEIPGLLDPNINNPGDMLNELADKWDVLQPKYENPFDDFTNEAINHYTNMILQGALDGTLRQIAPTYADRMNNRISEIRAESRERVAATRAEGRQALEDLRAEKNARIEEIRQQGIARKQEALAKEREAKWAKVEEANRIGRARVKALRTYKNERIQATRKYYQDMRDRASTRRKNSETRTKIKGLINDMNSRLLHGTEKKYVPAELVENTVKILEMIDLDSGRGGVKLAEKIALLQQQYAKLKNDKSFQGYAYNPVIENAITEMAQTVGDTPLRNMNANQLDTVYNTLKMLEHTIRRAVNQKIHNDNINLYESGRNSIKATNGVSAKSANLLGNAADWYTFNTNRPEVVFERLGGFAKDSEWVKLFNMLNNAQRYGMDLQMKFAQPFEDLLKNKKDLAKLTSAKDADLVDIGLKDENGESIKITRDFMLFVYMNLFNEDNMRHIMFGGITVPELKEYLAGKGDRGFGKGHRKAVGVSNRLTEINDLINNAEDATEKARLLEEKESILQEGMEYIDRLRSSIEEQLTDYDRKWVDAWWKFNKMASEVMNETTMDVYGIKKFIVENYFPIITDKNYVDVPMETIMKDMSLENAGFTKERIHASTPIKMMGLADVINMQANRTAQYAAMMPATRAFNRIWNTTLPGYSTSLRDTVNSKFGSQGVKFVENLLSDLQGGRRGDFTIFDRLRGRMAQATLSLNPRVALAQTASFPTAAAELGWKPVMKALAKGGKNNALISAADRELIAKWSSTLWFRTKGATADLANVKNMQQAQHKVMDKLGWAMNWIEFMDSATVGRLWYAAQYYVDEKNPELQKGSDAYYEKVAEAFNRCIENTQPNYTTLQRPELLRDPRGMVRALTMFMTQRLQNQSILYGAVMKYNKYKSDLATGKNGVTQADVNEMRDRLVNAATSQIVAAMTIAIFKALCDGLLHRWGKAYRDDDEKLTAESVSLNILDIFAESIVSNVVGGSEIYSAAKSMVTGEKYYGIEITGISTFAEILSNVVSLVQKPSLKTAKKLGEAFAMFFGIPAANAEKIGQALWYWGEDIINGEFMEAGVERTDAMNAKLLTEAYASGDKKAIEKYSGTFEDDDDLLDSVRSYVKTGYVNKDKQTISKTEAVKLLVQSGMRQKDAEAKVQEWTCELVTGIPFSKIKDEFMAGNITQSRVIELLQKYGGRDKETADRTARSYACEKETGHPYTDLKEAYILGEVSRSVLEKAVKKYGGMNAEDAKNKLYYYDYLKENPTSDISENRAVAYMTKLKPAGIKAKDYEDILNKADADKNGAYTQNEVGSWLENKGYSKTQAEALWSAMGPTWKTGFDAWQVKYKADLAGNKNNNVSQKELGPYLVQQINSGKMSLEDAEGYWKVFFSKSSTTFKKWLKKNRYRIG